MSSFDFSPLFRSTVGFDRLMNLLEASGQWADGGNGYPPYNIEKTGSDQYRITIAVAGFAESELSVEVRENVLVVEGRKRENEREHAYLYRGIAGRSFKRQFQLADYVRADSAQLENGLLIVNLVRELPETMKPRQIPITTVTRAAGNETPSLTQGKSSAAA